MNFSSEEKCLAANQKLSTDWKKTVAGTDSHVAWMIATTCLER